MIGDVVDAIAWGGWVIRLQNYSGAGRGRLSPKSRDASFSQRPRSFGTPSHYQCQNHHIASAAFFFDGSTTPPPVCGSGGEALHRRPLSNLRYRPRLNHLLCVTSASPLALLTGSS